MGGYEIDGESCYFVNQERMQDGLENNDFLDVDEHDGYLIGTTTESVRTVMAENKLCVLDVRPEVSVVKILSSCTVEIMGGFYHTCVLLSVAHTTGLPIWNNL